MTDAEPAERAPHAPAVGRMLRTAARARVTLLSVGVLLLVGVATGTLWRPFSNSPAWDALAYGLPAFEAGRWWTPITGTLLISHPALYGVTLLSFLGMASLEVRRGWRVAMLYFWTGQLFAVFGAALVLWLLSMTPSAWAGLSAEHTAVGPAGGTLACIAAAVGLLPAPWRVRAWLALLAALMVTLLFWGRLSDVQNILAVLMVLFTDRTLRIQHTTVREQRLIAFVALVTLGVVELVVLLAPTDGPFGDSDPASGSWLDIASDVVLILIVANALRRGRRWAWWTTLVLAVVNVVTGSLLLLVMITVGIPEAARIIVANPTLSLATSVMWLTMGVYLVWVRHAFRSRIGRRARLGSQPAPDAAEAKDLVRRSGGGNLSWVSTWDDKHFMRTRTGIVAYQQRAGVALALGDPLGAPAGRAQSVREFIDAVEHAGLIPCFFSATEATRRAVPASWRSLVVADDTIVDLPDLSFTGKRWNSVRTSINRAAREGVVFRLSHLKQEPWGVQAQLQAISEMWVGDRGLPEMGFTLGTLSEAEDPEVRLALAVSPDGDVDGFLSWMPVFGPNGVIDGWTLDLMRRREGGFGPVMEYLIAQSAMTFRDEGAAFMSLSGAPLAHDYPPGAGRMAELSEWLSEALEPVYGFRSLHRFKSKFHPRYERMHLLYRDEGDLTRVAGALTRAFLPDATLRQFAGAGIDMLRPPVR
ncbi:MAG TPA: phosphatidylglycerol lysyltransferase domain-containing protein [Microbacterium sp.]|nr:phosphatidylglycerol lysyltransferase domain-containing protein [Microbacterium sp.]